MNPRPKKPNLIPWILLAIATFLLGKYNHENIVFYAISAILAIGLIVYIIKTYYLQLILVGIAIFVIFLTYNSISSKSGVQANAPRASSSSDSSSTVQTPTMATSTIDCQPIQKFDDFIKQWCNYIIYSAEFYQQDPVLIASIILRESKGNPKAVSSSGAIGLMQVMPYESDIVMFKDRPTIAQLFLPGTNIQTGTQILTQNISIYGSIREGIFHYGPVDVGYRYADSVLSTYNEYK